VTDQVDADDMGIAVMRDRDPDHRDLELLVDEDLVSRNPSSLQDLLAVIDVGEESVDRRDALDQSLEQLAPVLGRDDPRHHIRGDQALGAALVAIDRERDPGTTEDQIGLGALARHRLARGRRQPLRVRRIVGADR
jgi:hypothetical protein